MVARRSDLAILGVLLSCASAQAPVRYRLENQLAGCLEVEGEAASWRDDLAVLEVRYHLAKSTAECGCKSALSAYSSYAEVPDGERYLSGGAMTLSGQDSVSLPLTVDRDLLGDSTVRVSIGCEQPD